MPNNNTELKQILLSIVGNAPFGIITIDFKGLIILINQQSAKILGLTEDIDSYLDVKVTDLFSPDSNFARIIENCIKKGRVEFDIDQEVFKQKILSVKGRLFINGMLITFRDITESVKAQEQLKERTLQLEINNKELEQFAYISSHDLQEPLYTILGFTNFILNETNNSLPPEITKYLNIISQASERMSDQIKGLLEYSRIGKNKQKTTVNCTDVVDQIEILLANQIKESNAKIKRGQLATTVPLVVFKEEFESLLQNLISNAIKYRKNDVAPLVEINCEESEEQFLFSVKDNGIGIPNDQAERVFIIFQRLHNRDEYSGNGIGLAHCKKIVQLHGGDIWFEAPTRNGTTFYFTIKKELWND